MLLFSCSVMSDSLWPHGLQHTRLPCPSPTPRACSNSCPLSLQCHPTISSSVFPFSSCLQSFPASRSFPNELVLHIRWSNYWNFPGGSDGKASAYNAGDLGSIPGSGRSPGEGNGNPLQESCLEDPMDGGAWWAIVHGVAKSRTWLSDFTSPQLQHQSFQWISRIDFL